MLSAVVAFALAGAVCSLAPTVIPFTAYPGSETSPAFSPDGMRVAFVWNGEKEENSDIYVKSVDSAAVVRLTSDRAEDQFPAWSPDGKWIGFRRSSDNQNAIYVISPGGGAERKLADVRGLLTGMSWSPDGKWLAAGELGFDDWSGIVLIPFDKGERRKLISKAAPSYYASPAFSPDGRFLAFVTWTNKQAEDLHLLELNGDYSAKGEPRRLTHHGGFVRGVAWTPDGRWLVYSHSVDVRSDAWLWQVPVFGGGESKRLELAGVRATWPAVARKGNRLVYRSGGTDFDIWKLEAGEPPRESIFAKRWDFHPRFSCDGTRLAFSSRRGGGRSAIWVSNADGSRPVQITSASDRTQDFPCWSPDGRSIAFNAAGEGGAQDIYVVDVAGGEPRQLTRHPSGDDQPSWSRDGRWIYFHSNRGGRGEVMRVPAAGGEAVQVTDNGGYRPLESNDGRTLYYVRPPTRSAAVTLFARPVAGGPEWQVLDSVLAWGFWVAERGIYYFPPGGDDGSLPLRFYEFASGESRPVAVVRGRFVQDLTVAPDGKTVLFTARSPSNTDLMLMENFR